MQCEQAHEHLSAYLDRELTSALASAVRAHVASCPDCRRTLQELRATAALLGRLPVHAAPEGLADDILREIEHRMLAPDSAADTPAPERTLAVHRARRWPRVLAVAACAALAAGIGLMTYLGTLPTDQAQTPAPMGPGSLALRGERHYGEALKSADDGSTTLAGDHLYAYAGSGAAVANGGTFRRSHAANGHPVLPALGDIPTATVANNEDAAGNPVFFGNDAVVRALPPAPPGAETAGSDAAITLASAVRGGRRVLFFDHGTLGLTADLPELESLAKAGNIDDANGRAAGLKAKGPGPDAMALVEAAPVVGKGLGRPEGATAMKKAAEVEKPPVEKSATGLDVTGTAQAAGPLAGETDIESQGKVATQIAKALPYGRTADDLDRAGQSGGAGQAAQTIQPQEKTINGTTIARGRTIDESAFAAKDAGHKRADGRAGGTAPTNAPDAVQFAMNSVALGQAPVDALRRTATPETLQQSENQLIVRADSREAANSELVHLFIQNGWAEVGEPAAEGLEYRKNAEQADQRAATEVQAEPQAATEDPAGPQATPQAPADQPPTTPGVYYLAHSDGEDTWVVVTSADDLSRFATQVAQSRTMIVGADSTRPFQAVRGLQRELATFEALAEATANRRSWGGAAPPAAEKAEADISAGLSKRETVPEIPPVAPAVPQAAAPAATAPARARPVETRTVPPPVPEPSRPTALPQTPARGAAKEATDTEHAFAAGVEVKPAEEPPADAEKQDRAPAKPLEPPAAALPGEAGEAVQGQARQRPSEGWTTPSPEGSGGTRTGDEDDKARWSMRDEVARQSRSGAGASQQPESGGRAGAMPGGPARPLLKDGARQVRGLLANVQGIQRLPDNQIMLIVRVQRANAEPPAACIRQSEQTEAETAPPPEKGQPTDATPADATERQTAPATQDP